MAWHKACICCTSSSAAHLPNAWKDSNKSGSSNVDNCATSSKSLSGSSANTTAKWSSMPSAMCNSESSDPSPLTTAALAAAMLPAGGASASIAVVAADAVAAATRGGCKADGGLGRRPRATAWSWSNTPRQSLSTVDSLFLSCGRSRPGFRASSRKGSSNSRTASKSASSSNVKSDNTAAKYDKVSPGIFKCGRIAVRNACSMECASMPARMHRRALGRASPA
mmetsp:Transcript_3251/g.9932  ORF Transcript_3251/g.9932 Transcript_3251/m.9932 type:complete len:223 (-) Transcript_3251:16-684(-)